MKAVIPAAGFGTRFLPATKSSPKEMLPLLDKPVIQYVVEECVASGIRDILIVTGRGKRAIEDHFDRSFELEALLAAKKDTARLRAMEEIASLADIHYVRQGEPKGLGHAVLCARHHVGDEPFAVLLGDDVVAGRKPGIGQLVEKYARYQTAVLGVEEVAPETVSSYGIVDVGEEMPDGALKLRDLVEKPAVGQAPSNLGIMGRYVLPGKIFDILARTPPGKNGEIQLTDALRTLNQQSPIYAARLEGKRFDLGNKLGWLQTNLEFALEDKDLAGPMREFMARQLAERR